MTADSTRDDEIRSDDEDLSEDEKAFREAVEKVGRAYFATCRKLASIVSRLKGKDE